MSFELFQKECVQTAKSLIYWIYVICLLLFFFTQMGSPGFDSQKEPEPGQESYSDFGVKYAKDEKLIMGSTLGILAEDLLRGSINTYPAGFIKVVHLSDQDQQVLEEILERDTGLSLEEAKEKEEEFYASQDPDKAVDLTNGFRLEPVQGLTYEAFQKDMETICSRIGAGSDYEEEAYGQGVPVSLSYEEAKENYDNLAEKDKLTGGYARLFSDYLGIALGILPVFVAVTRCMRDKRAQMRELIYVRKASAAQILLTRYFAMAAMLLLPVLAASCYLLAQCAGYALGKGISINYLGFLPYVFGWLLPEILVVSALGMFLTELTDTAAGILVQVLWWFADVFMSTGELDNGDYGMHLVMRHNTIFGYDVFWENFHQLVWNRAFYVLLSAVLIAAAVFVYDGKRRGRWKLYGKRLGSFKRKHQA